MMLPEFNLLLDKLFVLAGKDKPGTEYVELLWERLRGANHEALRWALEAHAEEYATLRAGENLAHRLRLLMARWHEQQAGRQAVAAADRPMTPEEQERADRARRLCMAALNGDEQAKRVLLENQAQGVPGRGRQA